MAELLGRDVPLVCQLGGSAAVGPGQIVAGKLPPERGREEERRRALARKMAALCDIFVNDAFGTAHRAEGTTYGIAQFAPDRLRHPAAVGRD